MRNNINSSKVPYLYINNNSNPHSSLIYRKIQSPLLKIHNNLMYKNASLDINKMHHPRFNINRKIAKSSYIKQRIRNYSNLMNNMISNKYIYNEFSFQKAPSFNENISEIHQIINGKRHKKIKHLDNLFFNNMFSNEYLDDIYMIKKNNILFQRDKNKLKFMHRNNSCGHLISSSKKEKYFTKNEDSRDNESTNNSNIIKANNSRSIISNISNSNNIAKFTKNNISNISTTTNKSINTNKFPEIYSNSNVSINEENETKNRSNKYSSKLQKMPLPKIHKEQSNQNIELNNFDIDKIEPQHNDRSFITSLGVDKMKYKLNELLFENGKKNKKINEFEIKILKLKIFQIYQKENLELYLNDERFNIQVKIDHILKMYKIYENIYEEYQVDLDRYINFLYLVTSDFEVELQSEIKKKRELEYDVEVLVDKLITKQKELEYLIGLRNFLFTVKNKDKKIINLNEDYVIYKSKRKEFIEFLLNLFNREPNTMATKYLKRLIEVEELEELLMKKGRTRPVTRKNTSKIYNLNEKVNNDLISPPPPGEKIFEKVDDFFKIIENLEDRNISLLKIKGDIKLSIIKLKTELNNFISLEEDQEILIIKRDIIDRQKRLKNLKEKNIALNNKKESLIELYTRKNDSDISKGKLKVVSYNLFTNLSYFHRINYNNLIIKYKYPGLLFLEKLIDNFNIMIESEDFNLVFDIEECNRYLPRDLFNEIIRTKKEYFNDKNQYLIIEYTIKLIKLYEYLGEYILRKSQEYKKKNESRYKKYTEEIQNERKIYNARRIRKLIENKRREAAKKLIEKWERKPLVGGRKLDIDEKPFYLSRNLSQELLREKKKKETSDEFQNYKILMEDSL